MVFVLGVVLFAFGIALSIALHEFGHLLIAKAFGMKVRRYYIGFGPTLFSFSRGETEYGLKAIPAGGFCDIAGMTALDEVTPEEAPRAMYRQSAWKRIAVMLGGPITHFALGIALVYGLAVAGGIPNLDGAAEAQAQPRPAVVGQLTCAVSQAQDRTLPDCAPGSVGPAADAGIATGDTITAVNGEPTATFDDVVAATRPLDGTATFTVQRDGQLLQVPVQVQQVERYVATEGNPDGVLTAVGAIGVVSAPLPAVPNLQYSPLSAVGGTVAFTGTLFEQTWQGLLRFPEKIPAVVRAIGGGERDADTPISVVGASRIGGEVAEKGYWDSFVLLLAGLNFFIGVFNLLPLLPLDGGHMAVTAYEKVRNTVRLWRGKPIGAPVDYTKLLPLTYVAILIGGGISVLTIIADVVNPIQLF